MSDAKLDSQVWVRPDDTPATGVPRSTIAKTVDLFFDFLQSIALGGAFFVVFYLFIIQPHQVKGSSMFPTFKDKEYILTDKISYKFRNPQRGEVIILQSPANADIDYIKRVIGLPGEHVRVSGGTVFINGKQISESYLEGMETHTFPGGFLQEDNEVVVPDDNYFVMGDNRPGSSDSREFGFVPSSHIIGHVIFRYFPVDRVGIISPAQYGNEL
ncbi:MAG: signal peptidase I [Patescibacteria group bacterium]|jgi:signal peptidase I